MFRLEDEPKLQLFAAVASNPKSHCIVNTPLGHSRTRPGVTEIAKVPQFLIGWFCAFVTGRAAMASPTPAQRQPRGMKPSALVQLVRRHEKWTGHSLTLR